MKNQAQKKNANKTMQKTSDKNTKTSETKGKALDANTKTSSSKGGKKS